MSFQTNIRLQSILLFFLAAILYVNTLGHDFVMDDRVVVTENKWAQQGLGGILKIFSEESFSGYLSEKGIENTLTGGRYRPLSLAFFATLVQFFGNNSFVFHLFTVLLFSLSCFLLHRFLFSALKTTRVQDNAALISFISTALFAAHPVHTEVVANVKSCDELLAFLAGIGSLYALLKAHDSRRQIWNAAAGGLFLLACLAKENAATLLVIAPLTLWFFRRASPREILRQSWPLLAAFAMYVGLRGAAVGWQLEGQMMHDPLNNPFLKAGAQQWVPFASDEKIATIFYTLLEYLRLLVWPWPLTHDYYPFHISAKNFSNPAVIASVALHLILLGLAVWLLKKRKLAGFGLIFYLVTLSLVANIFFPVGTFMAERFLFMPSAGFCLAVAALVVPLAGKNKFLRYAMSGIVSALLVVWGVTTWLRNAAWASEEKLLKTDVATSANSAKLHNSLGTLLLTQAQALPNNAQRPMLLQEAETHLRKAIELHPTYYDAFLAYGACVFYLQKYDFSVQAYRGAHRMNAQDPKAKIGLAYALRYGGDFYGSENRDPNKAIQYFTEAWQLNPDTAIATHLAAQYQILEQPREAALWLEQALSLSPGDARLIEMLNNARAEAKMPAQAPLQTPNSFLPK
jgi:Tfp pilus assembly protein PilF